MVHAGESTNMSSKSNLWARIALNEQKQCKLSTCSKPRKQMGGYCNTHTRRVTRWGSPKGFAWQRSLIDQYLEAAEKFVRVRREHVAIKAGLDFLDTALTTAGTFR